MVTRSSWGVVGGGILGMYLSLRLSQNGYPVTLFEAESRLGGLARPFNNSGISWDRYYHVILSTDTRTRDLLQEFGLEEDIQWIKTRSGFYSDGRFYSISNIWEYLRFPLLNAWDKFRLGQTILCASKIRNTRKFQTQSVEEWLTRWSGKAAFNKIWLPLLRSKLGDAYKETSAVFIKTTIARMYSARNRGQKVETFGYVPGGYKTILRRFTECLRDAGVRIKTSHPVQRVESRKDHDISVISQYGKTEHLNHVILTVPSPSVASLCPALSQQEISGLNRTPYLGIICGSLLLKKPLAGFYITNITDERIPFTAVIEMTTLMDRSDFNRHSLVYLPKYMASDDPLFTAKEEKIQEVFFNSLLRMYPQLEQDDLVCFRTSKDRYVFSPPFCDTGSTTVSLQTSIPGIFTVNSAHITEGTLNVNETLALAERALDKLLRSKKCHDQ